VRRFLFAGLRLRTACDLEVNGELIVTRPGGFTIPDESALLKECKALITECRSLFAKPAVTEVVWSGPAKKAKGKKGTGEDESGDQSAVDEDENE
jgi:hypothetical protein